MRITAMRKQQTPLKGVAEEIRRGAHAHAEQNALEKEIAQHHESLAHQRGDGAGQNVQLLPRIAFFSSRETK